LSPSAEQFLPCVLFSDFSRFTDDFSRFADSIVSPVSNVMTAYQLQSTSPLRHAGLDLSQFNNAWDPYAFANDSFFASHFGAVGQDFYGHALPAAGSSEFSMAAEKLS
jgi:hypothetical protein